MCLRRQESSFSAFVPPTKESPSSSSDATLNALISAIRGCSRQRKDPLRFADASVLSIFFDLIARKKVTSPSFIRSLIKVDIFFVSIPEKRFGSYWLT